MGGLERPGGGPRKRYLRFLEVLASDFSCLVKLPYVLFLEAPRVISVFLLGGGGNRSWRGLLGIFWKGLWVLEGLGEAVVTLAMNCEYSVEIPYSMLHFMFSGALCESKKRFLKGLRIALTGLLKAFNKASKALKSLIMPLRAL